MKVTGTDVILRHAGRARRWVGAGALAGLLAGVGWHVSSPPTFRASAVIELSEVPSTIDLGPGAAPARAVSIDTDAQLVVGDAVTGAVAEAVGVDAATARRSTTIAARPLTRVLAVTYAGRTAAEALTGARAAADAFLAERERTLIAPLRAHLLEVAERQEPEGGSAVVATEETSARVFPRPVLDNARRRAVEASLALPGPGRVLEATARPPRAQRGQLELPLASGAAVGGLLGLAAGIAWSRRPPRTTAVPLPLPLAAAR